MRNASFLMMILCFSAACTPGKSIGDSSKDNSTAGAFDTIPANQAALGYKGISEKNETYDDEFNSILAVSKDKKITISIVPDETVSRELSGCGCSFYPTKDKVRTILGWLEQESPQAIMKINGNLEKFTSIHERNQRAAGLGGRPESGDKTTFQLLNAKYETNVECKVSDTCWGEDGCEHIDYKCSITAKSTDGSLTIPAVGTCGC